MDFWGALYSILLFVLTVVVLISNTFCIIVLWKVRSVINEAPQVLMTSLSLADLLNGISCLLPLFLTYLFDLKIPIGGPCQFQAFLVQTIQVTKVMSLLALNFDRYIAVTRALHYHKIITPKRVYIVVAALWILSIVTSLIYGGTAKWKVNINAKTINTCVFELDVENLFHWMNLILLVILPLIVTIVIYIRLATLARHHAAQIGVVANYADGHGNQDINQQHLALRNQAQKASKTTRLMTLVFAMTCGPFILAQLLATYIDFTYHTWILNTFLIISFCNGLCNITVYFFRHSTIRATSRAIVRQRLLPCQQVLLSSFTQARQHFTRIRTRNNQHVIKVVSAVHNSPMPSLQSIDAEVHNSPVPSLQSIDAEVHNSPMPSLQSIDAEVHNSPMPSLQSIDAEVHNSPMPSLQSLDAEVHNSPMPSLQSIDAEVHNSPVPSLQSIDAEVHNSPMPSLQSIDAEVHNSPMPSLQSSDAEVHNSPVPSLQSIDAEVHNSPMPSLQSIKDSLKYKSF